MPIKRLTYNDVRFSIKKEFLKAGKKVDLWFDQKRIKNSVSQIANGYDRRNLYLSGSFTAEDRKYLENLLRRSTKNNSLIYDWCYIYNFKDPLNPLSVRLSAGKASKFKRQMKRLLENFKREIPEVLENKDFSLRIREIINKTNNLIGKNFSILKDAAAELDFSVKPSAKGLQINPIVNGKLITESEYASLSNDQKKQIEQKRHELDDKIADYLEKARTLEKSRWDEIEKVKKEAILLAISHYIDEIEAEYADSDKIKEYLKGLEEYTLENAEEFLPEKSQRLMFPVDGKMLPFEVNLLVDASNCKDLPIVYEDNPTFYNIVGKIEKKAMFGNLVTDFTLIKPGALHKANGGYLILDADRVLSRPGSWWALKNALLSESIKIEDIQEQFGFLATTSMKPEPIPLSVKVILLGSRYLYNLLSAYDAEFSRLFNLKSDFDYSVDLSGKNVQAIVSVLQNQYENVVFSESAFREIIKYVSKIAGNRKKISSDISRIASVCEEAVSKAKEKSQNLEITGEQIREAIKNDIYRKELAREKIVEMIKDNQIIIHTEGKKIGQINGLAVLRDGDFTFGTVSRISASCFMGKTGVVNIERESNLSGKTFNKASMIISGYIGQKYAQRYPLSLSVLLAFEQSYGLIDGDSASVAELMAILSRIADIPIRQDIAVTGSLSQAGEVQPIGGVVEKIEGFYRICKEKGLTGTQGVLFPEQNMTNLILPVEIENAIKNNRFNLYTMSYIDDAIELLSGIPAGKPIKTGYQKNSFHYFVDKKLKKYARYGIGFEKDA